MNHPTHHEWLSFLYREVDAPHRARLQSHLRSCSECLRQVQAWRGTLHQLDAWQPNVPARRPAAVAKLFPPALLRWAAAALVVLGIGLLLGRVSAARGMNPAQWQATLLPELRQQLRAEFTADLRAALASEDHEATNEFRRELRVLFVDWAAQQATPTRREAAQVVATLADAVAATRAEDQQVMRAGFEKLDRQSRVAYAWLKQNLETVALVADDRIQRTENQLGELISTTPLEAP